MTASAPAAVPSGAVFQAWDVERDLDLEADAVVVGSGAGGACVAAELAEDGRSVIVLEEGGVYGTKTFDAAAMKQIVRLYRSAGAEIIHGRPKIMLAQGRCLGGSTVINGGMSWRTPEPVLHRWTNELGLPGVRPDELEPIFERVERRIHVNVQAPETYGRDAMALKVGAERLGYRLTPNRRNQDHCMGSNNCAFGCPTGGKQSMLVSYLPRAAQFGARIYADCRVERILTERGGPGAKARTAVGVEGRVVDPATGRAGPRIRVRAKATVIACGATETPALLLRNGLANRSGQVGRNFTVHPNVKCVGIFDDPIYGWRGVHQAHQVHEFLREGFLVAIAFLPPQILALSLPHTGDALLEVMEQLNHMVVAGALVEDTGSGTVRPGPFGSTVLRYALSDHDVERLRRGIFLTSEILFAAGARKVLLPIHGRPPLTSPDQLRSIFEGRIDPRDLEVVTVHPMGTCRIGVDPRRSVAGPFGESHDVASLYIADGSALPTALGLNPMLTILTLATRTALRVLGRV